MFRRIMVPLDGSPRAERAAYVAERLAKATGSDLVFMRVVDVPVHLGPSFEPPPVMLSTVENDLNVATEYLSRFAHRPEFTDLDVEIIALEGPIAATLIESVVSEGVDLIIMCSHGWTGALRWPLGSVAQKLARRAPVPTLVLREGGLLPGITSITTSMRPRGLVALDGSEFAERALAPALDLAVGLALPDHGELQLLHVLPYPRTEAGTETGTRQNGGREARIQESREYLLSVARKVKQNTPAESCPNLHCSVIVNHDVAGALIAQASNGHPADTSEAANHRGYDFIAMATHGRGGWQRIMLGSVTERVLHASPVPLLIVPPESRMMQ